MFPRTRCPITGIPEPELILKVDLPYDSGLLGEWARQRKQLERFAPYRFTILHNPKINFYFQKWVFDQTEEIQRREAMARRQAQAEAPRESPPPLPAPSPLPAQPQTQPQLPPQSPPAASTRVFSLTELSQKAEDAMLIRLLHPDEKRRPRVLDYGMGSGEWPLMARAYGSEVWGTDVDPRSARAAAESGIRFGELESMPDGYFDFINADQVFEHLPDPLGTLQALCGKLAPGGHVKLSTPADEYIEQRIARLQAGRYTLAAFKEEFHALSPLSHINLYSAEAMQALGKAAGLEPFQLPLKTAYSTVTGFHSLRQINRNVYNPWKRHRARGTWQFFVKS